MSFKNISILWKVSILLVLLGAVAIGAIFYAGSVMRTIDDRYSDVLANKARVPIYIVRVSRNMALHVFRPLSY